MMADGEPPPIMVMQVELVQQVAYWWFGGLFRYFAARVIEPER